MLPGKDSTQPKLRTVKFGGNISHSMNAFFQRDYRNNKAQSFANIIESSDSEKSKHTNQSIANVGGDDDNENFELDELDDLDLDLE